MRSPNEIDFWRGLALVSIFVNHIPGFYFERFTHRNWGLSDSAELFVFLAGWSLRRLADRATGREGALNFLHRLGGRVLTLYLAQIVISVLALGIVAAASFLLDNPLILEWNNAAVVFQDPVRAHLALVLMSHQLGFFDILPLYVVLMLTAPGVALVERASPALLLALSGLVYATALAFAINVPTWPVEGTWYFDPFAWQLIFVLGFLLASSPRLHAAIGRRRRLLRAAALVVVGAAAVLVLSDVEPDPLRLPQPRLFFIFDKTFMTPARVVHFLALALLFGGLFPAIVRWVPRVAGFLSMLGRNSLHVFCVGSLLSLLAQVVRYAAAGDRMVDIGILAGGIAILGLTAWLSEWRERSRKPSSPSA